MNGAHGIYYEKGQTRSWRSDRERRAWMGPECADDARGEDAEHLFSETRRSLEENCKKRLEWLGDSLEACAERVRALKEAPLPLADDPDGLAAFGEVKDDVEFELELQFSRMRSAVAHVRKHFADPFEGFKEGS
ncbi:hypothetical protein DIPPA_13150 [Diplonema papillatum]|nr:hypothetical protein DIPPA_03739 [Diplonema papillatum]KAJ9457558.1 hypothetical protein DIPPA_13150 [Diplonema papillatum]